MSFKEESDGVEIFGNGVDSVKAVLHIAVKPFIIKSTDAAVLYGVCFNKFAEKAHGGIYSRKVFRSFCGAQGVFCIVNEKFILAKLCSLGKYGIAFI